MMLTACVPLASPRSSAAQTVHPQLLQIAAEEPTATVRVIVQKAGPSGMTAQVIRRLGGTIYRDLYMVNSLAVELPAAAIDALGRSGAVRWISPDGAMYASGVNTELEIYYLYNNLEPTATQTVAQQILPLNPGLPSNTTLFNYDMDRNSSEGLTIQRGGSGALETQLAKIQRWQLPTFSQDYQLQASVQLKFYATMADPQAGQFGKVRAFLIDRVGDQITLLAQGTTENADWPIGWHRRTLRFGAIDHLFLAGHQLEVAITVDPSSSSDMVFAYGVAAYPAHLLLQQQTDWPVTFLDTIGAPTVWGQGFDGSGITVAVVDSGSRNGVADFKNGKQSRYTACVSVRTDTTNCLDEFGHGTYVAGLIGGNGAESGQRYMGVAPGISFVGVRVNDVQGAAAESDVVAGLQWIMENKDSYNIRVVNLSLNSNVAQPYHLSPLNLALEILWFKGIVVVAAAGNNGASAPGMLYAPANDPFAIVVGAIDEMTTSDPADDQRATFSAYGTTLEGHAKPDIAAPGVNLVASMHAQSRFRWDYSSRVIQTVGSSGSVNNKYFLASGTSAAAGVVSGAVALLLQAQPNLTPDQVKYLLQTTATALPGTSGVGAGLLNVANLVNTARSYTNPTDVPKANVGTMPHMTLAQMALLAYWSSVNGGDAIDWNSVDWNSVNWNSVNWNSVNWNSVNWNSVNWNSVNWNSVNWNSVNWNSVNWNSVNWNSVNWNSVNWNSVIQNSIDMDY